MDALPEQIQPFLQTFLLCAGAAILLAIVLLVIAARQVRKIDIPPDADLTTTLKMVPLLVVLGIDLLDFALDVLAVPIVWVVLDRMGLRALRNVSSIEAFIPFTGPIPVFTVAWILVRLGLHV